MHGLLVCGPTRRRFPAQAPHAGGVCGGSRGLSFADTRGLTGSDHLQSFWLQFNGTLADPAVLDFFSGLRPTRDRTDLNLAFEHRLSEVLDEAGVSRAWAWDAASFGYGPQVNPSLCWRELLDAGFPFVKRKLLSDHPRFRPARDEVVHHVHERYGVDLA